ncbi:hypothetical protein F966_01368 [Acinetobacter higginsii]|uniref:Response receiver domain-containing protein n=1 Tax=Acinetobacter higginsii TaxID=70347 RepID=N8WE62_9GAMM|nr:response regulator receiver domain [Acinetobacter higginsii]ENV10196.1 hypothetical protein F966_01368 [Acinetobacter higginsii]
MIMQNRGNSSTRFFEISRLIAENFIHTVVAIDDEMGFEYQANRTTDFQLDEPSGSPLGTPERSEIDDNTKLNNPLNYQNLSKYFAEKSIVCSGLKPLEGDSYVDNTTDAIFKLSKKADITILDWQMEKVNAELGLIATKAIEKIIESDVENNGRLRLILIYSGEKLETICDNLAARLSTYNLIRDIPNEINFSDEKLRLCKIVFISKNDDEEKLASKAIDLFTEMTYGLLSNATLAGITEIRERTHNLLYKFNKSLDPAYLSHVLSLISSPDMREQAYQVAFDYAVDLISEEIKSELQISKKVKKSLDQDALLEWPNHINPRNNQQKIRIKIGSHNHIFLDSPRLSGLLSATSESLQEVLDRTPVFPNDDGSSNLDTFKKSLVQLSIDGDSLNEHLELSVLQCIRRDNITLNNHIPVLKQGVILRKDDDFYVCIQPLCDSVRLRGLNSFAFIKVKKGKSKFSHVLKNIDNTYTKLEISKPTSKQLCMIVFNACDEDNVVKATKINDQQIFKCNSENSYIWCGEFKQPIYQEIVNLVSSSLSRVGFDSFEWLRMRKS